MPITIQGTVEGVIYFNPDNGYTVMSLSPDKGTAKSAGGDDEIVVVGKFPELHPGETLQFTGEWAHHKEYGQQFKADSMKMVKSAESVKHYLVSGAIPGITEPIAKKILTHFGQNALEILDANPDKIHDVPGLKEDRAEAIANAWTEARRSRKALMYLQTFGIMGDLAHRILDIYGDDTIEQIDTDPYQLALEVEGFTFKIADRIATSNGLENDSPARIRGGIVNALAMLNKGEGHIYAPRPMLAAKAAELLEVDQSMINPEISALIKSHELIKANRPVYNGEEGETTDSVLYLPHIYEMESETAGRLMQMVQETQTTLTKAKKFKWKPFFEKLQETESITLTKQQQEAVKNALTNKISVLTGGPGTGKTTTLKAVIYALDEIKAEYQLASPTGRAARRLAEATGQQASTIHRMLGYNRENGFVHGSENPLTGDMFVVDEASMVDLDLFAHLLDAIPPGAHLLLVGDVDQLPSVGAGDVLHDVIRSGIAKVTKLDAIFRQAEGSLIVVNAHSVNHGTMPDLTNKSDDFYFFGLNGDNAYPNAMLDLLTDIVTARIPSKFDLDPVRDLQILAPMYKGEVGIDALNTRLQSVLNGQARGDECVSGTRRFRIGDKVIQTRNNYDKDTYNGDIGRIHYIDANAHNLTIDFDGRSVDYQFNEMNDVQLAYAISIHRSQGGEYPAIVMPVVTGHYRMLQRNLLYTAITRAKRLVVLVGQKRAIQIAVENNHIVRRYSALGWILEHPEEL